MKIYVAALVLSFFTTAALAAPNSQGLPGDTPTEQRHGGGGANKRDGQGNDAPLEVRIVEENEQANSRRYREQAAERERQQDRDDQVLQRRLDLAQAFFAVVGIVLVTSTLIYTARAANAAKRSADHANTALDYTLTSAEAAVRSADAAEKALGAAHMHMVASLRALLAVVDFDLKKAFSGDELLDSFDDPKNFIGITIAGKMKNLGSSIAKDAYPVFTIFMGPKDMDPQFDSADQLPVASLFIPPGSEFFSPQSFISKEDLNRAFAGESKIVVRTKITYTDALSGDPHITIMLAEVIARAPFDQIIQTWPNGIMVSHLDGGEMT